MRRKRTQELIDEAVAYERERIAQGIESIEEFCKDYTYETGEVLVPRDVAANVARMGGRPGVGVMRS